ncbi:MAG: hypothetical protein CMJ01_01350 [Pelagibacteraceae bacterium]|nr:hypothetical protein [Pelagibacteraceae bacterium]
MKKIFKLLTYLIFIIYSVEILLFFFSSDLQKSLVNIKGKRIEIAKAKNKNFDLREPEVVYIEKKNKIKDLSVPFYYSSLFSNFETFKKAKKNNDYIPIRGPINKKTLSCAEDLNYRIINNDKYGFKNSNSIYDKQIEVFILGGSFAEGFCYGSQDDIAGNLIKENIQTLNLGVATTGPLVSLAVLKEFAPTYKPKDVFYLYYESNSLRVLNWEEKDIILTKYLEKNYKTNYIKNIDKVKSFLESIEKESLKIVTNKAKLYKKEEFYEEKKYLNNIKDILEINILKNRIRNLFNTKKNLYNLKLFNEIVLKMREETEKTGGNFTFVYIPSWDRFFNSSSNLHSIINLREEIIKNLNENQINVIDTTKYFSKLENLSDYYPLGYVGHFNEKGYKKVSNILKEKILN